MAYNVPKALLDALRAELTAATAASVALDAEETDFTHPVMLSSFVVGNGTWTLVYGGLFNSIGLQRTPSAANDWVFFEGPLPKRLAANRGAKPTGLLIKYGVSVASPVDIKFTVNRAQLRAHDLNTATVTLGGDVDAHYDADHDTDVKRGAVDAPAKYHTAVVTFPIGLQAYLLAGERLEIQAFVTPDVGGTTEITILGFDVLYTGRYNDVA